MVTRQTHVPDENPRHDLNERLREFPLFAGLPLERLTGLGQILVSGLYAPGEKIFSYGDPGDRIFFICRGTVALSLTDNLDHTETFGVITGGECVGEVAVFAGGIRTADGRVSEELVTLELRRDDVDRFLDICPEAGRLLLVKMAHRLESASQRDRHQMERISQAVQRRRTPADRWLARVVRLLGSLWFLAAQVVGSGLWMAFNRGEKALDPFPYHFLGLFLAAEALVATLLILRYQNREEESSRVRDAALDRAADEVNRQLDELLKRVPPSSS